MGRYTLQTFSADLQTADLQTKRYTLQTGILQTKLNKEGITLYGLYLMFSLIIVFVCLSLINEIHLRHFYLLNVDIILNVF